MREHCKHQGSHESYYTERTTRGAGDKRGGRGKEKTVGNRHLRRSVEGRGMGWGTQGKHNEHDRDLQVLTRQGISGRKAGNLKEVGLGWINGGEKRSWFWMVEDERWW